MLALLSTYRKELILTIGSAFTGLFIGGLLWGSSVETKTVYDFITQEKVVEVEKTVEVVKEVIVTKKEAIKADKVTTKQTRSPDGTVMIESEYYNLGVTSESKANFSESLSLEVSEKTKESMKQEHSEKSVTYRNSLAFIFMSPYNVTKFDYKTDWAVSYDRYLSTTPFYGSVVVGPKVFGLGFGFSF